MPQANRTINRQTPTACTRYTSITHPDGVLPTSAASPTNFLQLYARPPFIRKFVLSHGRGSWVYTVPSDASSSGERKYVDFTSGIAVNALGHADPQLAQVMPEQASKLSLTYLQPVWNEWAGKLAEKLVEVTRRDEGLGLAQEGDGAARVFFTNSGREANEGAFKFVRKIVKDVWSERKLGRSWTPPIATTDTTDSPAGVVASPACPKYRIACFQNDGRSMGALSATPNPKYQKPFEPLVPGFDVGVLNDFDGLEALVGRDTCAVIVEPIQGEGGLSVARLEWLEALRARCDEVGAVLIFDEIQVSLRLVLRGGAETSWSGILMNVFWCLGSADIVSDGDAVGPLAIPCQLPPGYHHDGQAAGEWVPHRCDYDEGEVCEAHRRR